MRDSFRFSADTANGYWEEAKELRRFRQFDEAVDVISKGLSEFPNDPQLLVEMGRHLRSKWLDNEAMECFEKAYRYAPDDQFIACDYADFLMKQGRQNESEIVYLHALDEDADNFSRGNMFVLIGLGNFYQKTGREQFAATCFGEAFSRNPEDRVASRRYYEVVAKHRVEHSEDNWNAFLEYAQKIVDEAGPAPEAPEPEVTPR